VGRGALITGASYRALGVVRSLGRAGVPVCVARTDEHALALASRFVKRRLRWESGPDGIRRDALIELCRRERLEGWTLIPTDDEDAALIAREHDALGRHFVLTTPPWDILRYAYDKRLAYQLAQDAGVPVPETHLLDTELLDRGLSFPVVVKPAFRTRLSQLPPDKAWRADDAAALAELHGRLGSLVDPKTLMVQELIPGEEQLSYAALCREGQVLARLTARRTRQFPLDFGRASTCVESTRDSSVCRDAERLLAGMRLTGIVEVEFKRDPRTGENKLLDVNPRVWGWQSMCARAGVDFPLLLWRMVNGQAVPPTSSRPGVHWVRMLTDVPAVIGGMRRGRLSAARYLRSLRGPLEFAVFAADDPLPAGLNAPLMLAIAAGRWRRGARI
jgi:predicted ATP-grasp superfamily ATP-dependent carboligase